MKKISHSETWTTADVGVNAIGKHRLKKRSIWEEDFAFHVINNMAQNNEEFKLNQTTLTPETIFH